MAIICDCCNKDITPSDETEIDEKSVLELNGGKKCFCMDCFTTLSEFACSDEHKEKTKEYRKQFEED